MGKLGEMIHHDTVLKVFAALALIATAVKHTDGIPEPVKAVAGTIVELAAILGVSSTTSRARPEAPGAASNG